MAIQLVGAEVLSIGQAIRFLDQPFQVLQKRQPERWIAGLIETRDRVF